MLALRERGDTIIEVMFSFVVFSLVVVSALTLMNQGVAMAERSLEITLVRQQIDGQVTMVQQAQQANSKAWQDLKAALVDDPGSFGSLNSCPTTGDGSLSHAQFMGIDAATQSPALYHTDVSSYSPAVAYAMVDILGRATSNAPHAYGLWLMLAKADKSETSAAYDLHVRACWPSAGSSQPITIGTVARLYAIN